MTELEGHEGRRPDIFKAVDGVSMRRILTFDAPSWEDARRVLNWAQGELRRRKSENHLSWDEARILIEQEEAHDRLAKAKEKRPRPRDL